MAERFWRVKPAGRYPFEDDIRVQLRQRMRFGSYVVDQMCAGVYGNDTPADVVRTLKAAILKRQAEKEAIRAVMGDDVTDSLQDD
ncbi:hypothetical protein SEA_SHAWTY_24 [Streptomyces phage Shawty]|uniref:Uncharacterized protein n=1 Tax=Streptomyces phage Shawty TaxID=2510521 RepID=A0A411CYG0_9CAUD|nr:hypothetical protein SEA_SHAWTY_24 [Streptomyces phage Shawty]